MLTKDLLRYDIDGEIIVPAFIDPDDLHLLAVAEQLLNVFLESPGQSRAQLLEESKLVVENALYPSVVARGLEKLLIDRTEFNTDANEELIQFRKELFTRTSQLLAGEFFPTCEVYQERVGSDFQIAPAQLAQKLYADLPDHQEVLSFKSLSAKRLLHRYNCALVQGLLLHCDTLELIISDSETAHFRQLFKYLRFHQLLATVQKDGANRYRIAVDGPLNLFYRTKRYGLNLANFFIAVLHQPKWQLEAQIRFRQKRYRLSLDNSCGILPDSRQFLAYIPEHIKLFQTLFRKKAKDWKIAPGSDFVPLEGEFYCFPDYTLFHDSGVAVAMELFHEWHASHLTARLQQLVNPEARIGADRKEPLLILGVSNVLEKDPLVAQALKESDYFLRFGFVFRQVPTAGKVLPVLQRILSGEDTWLNLD